jgi:hypothetical protein
MHEFIRCLPAADLEPCLDHMFQSVASSGHGWARHVYFWMTPQAIRLPELPAGSVL